MDNSIKKIFLKVLFSLLILLAVILIHSYIQKNNLKAEEKNQELQTQSNTNLQEELLIKEIDEAENFIKNVNNNIAITVLRTTGKCKLSHDKTPNNNMWTEWLFNSQINVYAYYNTNFTIETSNIIMKIIDNTVLISYDKRDITLSSIDITDFNVSSKKSILGSSYNPYQIAAFEKIARKTIYEKTNNENNIKLAKSNLDNYLSSLAHNLNVKINIIEKK